MHTKITGLLVAAMLLTGCAVAGKTTQGNPQQLDSRIAYLEKELDKQSRRVAFLEQRTDVRAPTLAPARARTNDSALLMDYEATQVQAVTGLQIQKALKNAGYYQGAVDGKIGPKTMSAIMAFQEDNGLKVDGKVGPATWSKLSRSL